MSRSIRILASLLSLASIALAQRPGYAGSMPYGYPVIVTTTTAAAPTMAGSNSNLGNRFGNDVTTAAPRLPLEANGDQRLINYLSSLPKDQQPFWFLNWQALEAERNRPSTYDMKPNGYIDFGSAPQSQGPRIVPDYRHAFDK